ncbi:uncharacterized protein LOC129595076 [Paramacrobiotus metropolitanus]|uniref:uncharacterized protein LOC129595076 n=1 Tax=Paramacrobiotus metropolitanus TaxID=2943436 RepID=UPI002445AF04|nr:uncharacterized protein LOC129595076 [Paramacrobiotus metropolitanus]XP_055347964.1 uncharacterized protein LOC129595076 [Paramacrobiotus metropolitanus]
MYKEVNTKINSARMKAIIILITFVAAALSSPNKRATSDQNPKIWKALSENSGHGKLSAADARDLYINAKPGQDYPNLSGIPAGRFDCGSVKPGFYADVDYQCQVIRRCDINGNQTAYLCPNMTVFNQITLVCDWFYNVDCSQARKWYNYSNSRLYQGADVALLDNQDQIDEAELEPPIPLTDTYHSEMVEFPTTTAQQQGTFAVPLEMV